MEADFSGYASKNGLKCSDGRTILAGAFKHQDKTKVPLVWQHRHNEATNVLGHAILEDRPDGVYAYGFFNDSEYGKHAKTMVQHGDIEALSIFANRLVERSKNVMHGNLVEVSLVLLGANPGAMIENVNIQHGDVSETLDDEAIIYPGDSQFEYIEEGGQEETSEVVQNVEPAANEVQSDVIENTEPNQGETVGNIVKHDDTTSTTNTSTDTSASGGEKTLEDILGTFNEEQTNALNYIVGTVAGAADEGDGEEAASSNIQHSQEGPSMGTRTIFDKQDNGNTLAHAQQPLTSEDLAYFMREGERIGSFRDAVLAHAEQNDYGIENIEYLFPDARNLTKTPEFISRRVEWVAKVFSKVHDTPFTRIKTMAADITADEARARGYVKGNLKKEEIFKILKRVTTPTTIYKKQKLDRDDVLDITDFDVIVWVKAEMRLMLDEEVARAILIGDGRDIESEDKIDEEKLRPIAYENDMYATKVDVASDIDGNDLIDEILKAQDPYKGTGTPDFWTTNKLVINLMLLKDKMGRRLYTTRAELAAAMGVNEIISVEVMEQTPDIVGILVNLTDYSLGADQGGKTTFFEDFDIDYNQQKYLLETRLSGALTKVKSAVVIRRNAGVEVTPQEPQFNATTKVLTIPTQTGVKYYIDNVEVSSGNRTLVETEEVQARPVAGYKFPHNVDNDWVFVVV